MTSQAILGFNAIVLTTTLLSGRCQSKPLHEVRPEHKLFAKSGEQCGAIEDPKNLGQTLDIIKCETGFRCFDSEGEVSWIGSGVCKEYEFVVNDSMLEFYDYSEDNFTEDDYKRIDANGNTYTDTENTEYDHSVDDFESEPRICDDSRSGLVLFTTGTQTIQWGPNCDDHAPELFESMQCGFDSQVTDIYCWCADTTSGKRLSAVNLLSIFDMSICE